MLEAPMTPSPTPSVVLITGAALTVDGGYTL